MEAFEVRKVPYFDIEDTITEVGISRRQLGHWQEQGLLKRELETGPNKYTVTDIRRLKALKHLVVDQRLPISLVKELVEGGVEYGTNLTKILMETSALFNDNGSNLKGKMFDFDDGELVDKTKMFHRLWYESIAVGSELQIERHVYESLLLLFRVIRIRLRKPAAFAERRDEILAEVSTLADVARVEITVWGDGPNDLLYNWNPSFPEEGDLTEDTLRGWFWHRAKRLNKYRDALQAQIARGNDSLASYASRFWTDEELSAVSPKWPTPNQDSQ